ncbi:ATP-binding cassette domain-containing protein [Herbiconiux sp. P16]|uniref:ABC transporter ATP-binding protein n=1 Tax=Herbiconiux wuyangfengii TaxID=3342794 RepID=UPI0035BB5901
MDDTAGWSRPISETAIEVRGLIKEYDGFRAVDGLDLSVAKGEIFGLLGPNGAGKTTTIECIVGLRRPTSGTVRVLGMDPMQDRRAITSRVAVQPQSASVFEQLTVAETLTLFASFHSRARPVRDVIATVGLKDSTAVRATRLSGGQLRRLHLGVALIGDPELLVLDEPSAGLDPSARQSLWRVIRELRDDGRTVLLSTHLMDEAAALCDRVAIVTHGRIAQLGTPDELIRRFSATSELSFTVDRETDPIDLAELLGLTPIRTLVCGERLEVHVQTADPDDLIRRLTFRAGIRARDYHVKRTSLEEVFLEVSGTDPTSDESGERHSRRRPPP